MICFGVVSVFLHYSMKASTILSVFSVLFACSAVAETFHISSSDGNDGWDGLSPETAWRTLDKLHQSWNLIGPGDSVLLERGSVFSPTTLDRNGIIRIPNDKAGTPGNPITIGAYGEGERPIVDFSQIYEYGAALRTGGLSYFTIQDIEFRGAVYFQPGANMDVGIHHLRLLRLKVVGGGLLPGSDGEIFHMFFYFSVKMPDNSQVPVPNTLAPISDVEIGWCEFVNTEGEDAVNLGQAGDHIWVHHNRWINCKEEALDIGAGSGHVIEYNLISGPSGAGIKLHSQSNLMSNVIVRGNTILKAGAGFNGLVLQHTVNGRIYNNTVYSAYSGYFGNRDRVQPESYYGTFESNRIFNNILMGCVQIQGSWDGSPIGPGVVYKCPEVNLHRDNTFTRNVYWTSPWMGTGIRFWRNGPYPEERATVDDSRTINGGDQDRFESIWASQAGEGERMINPLLVDARWTSAEDYGDFTPTAVSPCVDQGAFLANVVSENGSGLTIALSDVYGLVHAGRMEGMEGDVIRFGGTSERRRVMAIDYVNSTITVDAPVSWTKGQGIAIDYQGVRPDIGAWEYAASNQAPVLGSIGNQTVSAGSRIEIVVSGEDSDGNPLEYRASGNP